MKRFLTGFLSIVILLGAIVAGAQDVSHFVTKTGDITEDLYLVGAEVRVMANVDGDVMVIGGKVIIGQEVSGDVIAAGGRVLLRAEVGDDVRLAGGEVSILGEVDGDAIAVGGFILLDKEAWVRGRVWLAGGNIEVLGRINGDLDASGGRVVIGGHIAGDVELAADTIKILPDTVIEGELVYRSPNEAQVDSGARISGEIKHIPSKSWPKIEMGKVIAVSLIVIFSALLSAIVAGIVLYLLFPGLFESTTRMMHADRLACLGLGFILFIALPLFSIFLLVSVLGIPLAIIVIIVYLLALMVGAFVGAYYIGDQGLRWAYKKQLPIPKSIRIVSIIMALILIVIVKMIPLLGPLAAFLLLLMGLGALTKYFFRQFRA